MHIQELTPEILTDLGNAVTHNGCELLAASIDRDRHRITVLARLPYSENTQQAPGEIITWKYDPECRALYCGDCFYESAVSSETTASVDTRAREDFHLRTLGEAIHAL